MKTRLVLTTVLAVAVLCLAGCRSSEPDAPPDEKSARVTLRIATYDEQKDSGGSLVDHFVQAVHELDPTITVEPIYQAAPDEEATIKLIQAGDSDLGLVASRAWDLLGVDSLRAINTPFLIDSTELLDQVVASDEAAAMMEGLSSAHMTGLALLPEALRHPFGTETSPRGLDDYDGQTIRSPHSNTTWDLLSRFGATPMFAESGFTIAESQFEQAPAPQGTGNVTFYAKADVIVLSDAASKRLSPDQLDALARAAEATRDWAIDTFDDDSAAAAKYCKNGGRIGSATPNQIATLKDAAAPVIADLKADPATAAIINAIEELKAGTTASSPVTGCTGATTTSQASLLNGTYRWEVTKEALKNAGVTDTEALNDVPAINTATLKDGSYNLTYRQTEGLHKGDTGEGHSTYEYDGKTIVFHWSQSATNCTKATVKRLKDRSLAFSNIVECPDDEAGILLDQVSLRMWTRIK